MSCALAFRNAYATVRATLVALTLAAALPSLLPPAFAEDAPFAPRDESPEDFPAGTGRDDTFYACTACHGFKLIAQQGMNRRQWEDSLQWMVDRHGMPKLTPQDQTVVLDYLEAAFPPRTRGARGWQNPFAPR